MNQRVTLYLLVLLSSILYTSTIFAQITTVKAFNQAHVGFGNGLTQEAINNVSFPNDLSNISQITMYIKLECPTGGCGAWDVFSNISVKDPTTQTWYEMGRYITPYGVDNHARGRGFVFDVTDFKSLLTSDVELRSFTDVWTAEGWLISVEFDLIPGESEYPYTALAPAINYAKYAQDLPYGQPLRQGQTLKSKVYIPANAQKITLRSLVTGWGHARPDVCAEWCVKTHDVFIDDNKTFSHTLNTIGCAENPINDQKGNWKPNRAGWCPGMEVPLRHNILPNYYANESLTFEWRFQPYTTTSEAYYAISSFVVVKSHTPIEAPTVTLIKDENYCILKGANTTYEWIDSVELAKYKNTTGNNNGYASFVDNPITLKSGTYPVRLTPGSTKPYKESWRIWIDFNQDKLFDDSEMVFEKSGVGVVEGNLTIAQPITREKTRMRVAMRFNKPPNACGLIENGEVEDYRLNINNDQ